MQERFHSVKSKSNFEIGALFASLSRWWKRATISKLELFLTEWSRSYIVLALKISTLENSKGPQNTRIIKIRPLILVWYSLSVSKIHKSSLKIIFKGAAKQSANSPILEFDRISSQNWEIRFQIVRFSFIFYSLDRWFLKRLWLHR